MSQKEGSQNQTEVVQKSNKHVEMISGMFISFNKFQKSGLKEVMKWEKLTDSKKISIIRVLFSSKLSPFFFDCNRWYEGQMV